MSCVEPIAPEDPADTRVLRYWNDVADADDSAHVGGAVDGALASILSRVERRQEAESVFRALSDRGHVVTVAHGCLRVEPEPPAEFSETLNDPEMRFLLEGIADERQEAFV